MPAAESGEVYKTLDARCRACEVMGGHENPCRNAGELEAEERMFGYPCPRREWPDADGPLLFQLVALGAHEWGAHLFDWGFRIAYGSAGPDVQRQMFTRILAAYSDEEIAAILWPKQE